mgnify:CR=1 FL=1
MAHGGQGTEPRGRLRFDPSLLPHDLQSREHPARGKVPDRPVGEGEKAGFLAVTVVHALPYGRRERYGELPPGLADRTGRHGQRRKGRRRQRRRVPRHRPRLFRQGAQAQNDEVTESIISDLSNQLIQDRIDQLSGQIEDLEDALSSGSGSGIGVGGAGLTESQLDKNLDKLAGKGGAASTGSGVGVGKADETGGAAGDGTAPESTNNSNDIANDGAPCN